jgi:hypothetical protein
VALLSALWKVQGCATSWSPALALRNSPSSCSCFCYLSVDFKYPKLTWQTWHITLLFPKLRSLEPDIYNDLPTKHADLFKQKYESWIDAHRLSYQKNGDLPKLWISECQAELPVVPVPFSPSKGSPVVSSRSANGSCLDEWWHIMADKDLGKSK